MKQALLDHVQEPCCNCLRQILTFHELIDLATLRCTCWIDHSLCFVLIASGQFRRNSSIHPTDVFSLRLYHRAIAAFCIYCNCNFFFDVRPCEKQRELGSGDVVRLHLTPPLLRARLLQSSFMRWKVESNRWDLLPGRHDSLSLVTTCHDSRYTSWGEYS